MEHKFDLQFFGGGSSSTQYRKRDPEPDELLNLRKGLYDAVMPGLQSYTGDEWQQAKQISDNALKGQQNLLGQLPNLYNQNESILKKLVGTVDTGAIPSQLVNSMNASVNQGLQSGMGSMLSSLGNRGVLNSSITQKGINNLAGNAADAMNKNALNAFNSVVQGYTGALQGSQGNAASLLGGIDAYGKIPSQAYEGAYAGITPAYNLWKDWQNSYDSKEDYDTVVKQGK